MPHICSVLDHALETVLAPTALSIALFVRECLTRV